MCYRLGWVACLPEVVSALDPAPCVGWVEVHLFLRVSGLSVDYSRCNFSKEGSRTFDFDEASPRVFVSLPSPVCAKGTQHPAAFRLGPRRVVCLGDMSFVN